MKERKEESGSTVGSIKSFIYLDTDKMYSISSQIFEGMTDYILTNNARSLTESDSLNNDLEQRKYNDFMVESKNHQERKFLHDYAYTLFEQKLDEYGKVFSAVDGYLDSDLLQEAKFVRVRGRAIFNDTLAALKSINGFNELGYAFSFVTMPQETRDAISGTRAKLSKVKDRNGVQKLNKILEKIPSVANYAIERGLMIDREFLSNLAHLIEYGYAGIFEIQIPIQSSRGDTHVFSSVINREMLREDERSLMHKYSRESEKEITVFGILTQSKPKKDTIDVFSDDNPTDNIPVNFTMRKAFEGLMKSSELLGYNFTGKLANEMIIDPIAVYLEI